MRTYGELRALADEQLFNEGFVEALTMYTRLVELRPADLDARMRVGDALMAMGEVQQAAIVYTRLAQHAAQAGYPLRALVALKILSTLEPQLGVLLSDVAKLYGRDSGRIGRGVRRTPPDPSEPLPATWADYDPGEDRLARAVALASQYPDGALIYPERLIPIPLLSLLPSDEFAGVLAAVRLWRAQPGQVLIQQGAPGRSFFVIARGQVDVVREPTSTLPAGEAGSEQLLGTLHDGAIFGEMALLSREPRSATVRAHTDCDLLEFDRDALLSASSTLDNLQAALSSFAQERLLQNVLSSTGVFKPLDRDQRVALMKRFVAVTAEAGQALIDEGQSGRGLFVVLRGEVRVTKRDGEEIHELAKLGPTEAFGEISLLSDAPTTATVTATQTSTLLFLGREYFDRLIAAVPEIREYLERVSDERQMDTRLSIPDSDDDELLEPLVAPDEPDVDLLV
ncbi:MAG: cyclic nucleotide-binding domain-containing protein [Myxococcales bacterium]|nr:cyclic nucleotide-binding domain-containing protein [Myxococcales bacterium]MDD9966205.1 cyclic nucleotide-binding domain-containing protein [Myxococcales bacterium]